MQAETRYHPSADQLALAGELDATIGTLLPLSRLHSAPEESDQAWSQLADAGIFGICVDEALGGTGLGAAEEALIAMALGRRLASPAVFATLGAAHASGCRVDGRRVAAAYRAGERLVAVDPAGADLLLLRGPDVAAVYAAPGVTSTPLDDRLWLSGLHRVGALGEPVAAFDAAGMLRLRLIDAAALAGIAETALQMAVGYAGLREQFGRPIGTFQAVKHHCADMAIAARGARDQVSFASIAIDDGRDDARLQVECALAVAASAAIDNAGRNIQIHGGIGFSDEADPHLLLKRSQILVAIAGGIEAVYGRIADIG